jgi:arylsulfatase A-like enzyme
MLKPLGYRSYHSGKWHVDGKPLQNGFDHSYSLNDHNRHFTPQQHTEDDKPLPPVKAGDGYYSTTAIADHAIKCLKEHAAKYSDRPFFEFLAFTAPHFPLHAPAEDIARYRTTYTAGWDALREARWKRMQELKIGGTALSAVERDVGPPYHFPDALKKLGPNELNRPLPWQELTEGQREFQAKKMAVHAAMVDRMDREIGRVLAQLRAMGALDNTLIFFLSDNGASAEIMVRGDGHDPNAAFGSAATFLSIGPGWSTMCNTPFRRHKTWVHEGGIATPLIVHWPKGIAAKGELRHTPGHLIDLLPTILEAVGGKRFETWDGRPVPPAPGKSLVPVFARAGTVSHDSLWWLHEGNRALRAGNWKIVAAGKDSPWELYDLTSDRSESKNLAADRPEKVRELAALWTKQFEDYAKLAAQDLPPAAKPAVQPKPDKPNFILINIDDLGYADIGPFGSKINRTPNLDRMAKEGRKLTSFYAAPVCSPSRAALMTGCYPKRVLPIPGVLFPGNDIGLSPNEATVAEVLKAEGYATAIVGKWHLGDQPEFLPNQQGFDLHFGLPYSNDMGPAEDGVKSDLGKPLPKPQSPGQPPLPLLRNGTVVKRVLPDDQQALVELYTKESLDFIAANKHRPFFLYLAHNAVHFPIYPGKQWAGKSSHGIFSDWVEEVDWSVGQILNAVRQQGLAERTLVIFTSDNGGTPRSVNAPLRGHKASTWEGGVRVPTMAWWPGKIPAGTTTDAILGMFDILPTFAALAGGQVPTDRKIDGVNIWPQLVGARDAKPAHDTFYYYRGLRLEAVRHGDWKLQIASPTGRQDAQAPPFQTKLYNLKSDIGEKQDVAAAHPDVVKQLEELVAAMKDDLGLDGIGRGCRALGKVKDARPLIGKDGKVRPGLEPRK